MKQNIKIALCSLILAMNLVACSSSKKETPPVPEELKDTAVLQADEAGALEKLNQVIDTAKAEK